MDDSDSSSLSSVPPSEDEALDIPESKPVGLARYFKPSAKPNYEPKVVIPAASPPPPKREPSPPHEFKLIDNDAIAVIVMFRSRFHNAINRSCPNLGPQELEAGVREEVPSEQVERLLCSLLALCLNRKKDPEREHYGRALEEAVQTHSSQWPRQWEGKNPLHAGGSFRTMTAEQRLVLLRTLVYWSLSSSQAIQAILKESYKQARQEDDRNQPLSVQPWGRDGYKRRYWLVEGQDDTHFQLYRENNGSTSKTNVWFAVAGSIDEMNVVAAKLDEEATPHARNLRDKIRAAIPRFEAGEEKRRRRDYRLARKAAFARPELGFSLYEGRTRGKRMKYTFSDDDDDFSDAIGTRRSTRQSGISTPAESGPVVTASGRQVRPRREGIYGESLLTDQRKELDRLDTMEVDGPVDDEAPSTTATGRPQRSTASRVNGTSNGRRQIDHNSLDEMDEESDAVSDEHDWEAEDEEEPDFEGDDEVEESEDDSGTEDDEQDVAPQDSLVVQLRYRDDEKTSKSASPPSQPKSAFQDVRVVIQKSPPSNNAGVPSESKSVPSKDVQVVIQKSEPLGSTDISSQPINDAIKLEVPKAEASDPQPGPINGLAMANGEVSHSPAGPGQEADIEYRIQSPTTHTMQQPTASTGLST